MRRRSAPASAGASLESATAEDGADAAEDAEARAGEWSRDLPDRSHDAITSSGIKVVRRYEIPADKIPGDASVEMEAKKAAGYFNKTTGSMNKKELVKVKGRRLDE